MTTPEDDANGIARIADGDPAEVQRVRANLRVFARRADDPDTTRLVNEVLAGRRDIREVVNSAAFNRTATAHVDNLEEGLERMPAAERQALLARVFDEHPPPSDPAELDALRDS